MIYLKTDEPQFYNELFEMWGLQTGEVSWNESQRGYKI